MNKKYFIVLLIFIGAFLRFYNLNWGSPYYFHPDERNIVDLILKSSLTNPESLLKGTFAYGNFPVVLVLLLEPLLQPFLRFFSIVDPFAQIIIIIRTISAAFSVATLFVIYKCAKLWSEKAAFMALFLSVFSTGFIQHAHFGTYDGLAAFCAVTVFYLVLLFLKNKKIKFFYLSILVVSVAAASKINTLVLAIFPFAFVFFIDFKKKNKWLFKIKHLLLGVIILFGLIIVLSPNYLTKDFLTALFYERGLVAGTIPVFYTQSFYDTPPVIFQLFHILPFLLNPINAILSFFSFSYLLYEGIRTKNSKLLILFSFFLVLFLPQAFLHAKWTRYMVPTLPFAYLIISVAFIKFLDHFKKVSSIRYSVLSIFLATNILFGTSYFITTFLRPDTRIAGAIYAKQNILPESEILTEPYDLGIMPFSSVGKIEYFNFYEAENNIILQEELKEKFSNAEYIILPSQRLLRSRTLNPGRFTTGHAFYSNQLKNDFEKIYETPCDVFCKIAYLNDPVFWPEETATVFDHPTVFIFKKR